MTPTKYHTKKFLSFVLFSCRKYFLKENLRENDVGPSSTIMHCGAKESILRTRHLYFLEHPTDINLTFRDAGGAAVANPPHVRATHKRITG